MRPCALSLLLMRSSTIFFCPDTKPADYQPADKNGRHNKIHSGGSIHREMSDHGTTSGNCCLLGNQDGIGRGKGKHMSTSGRQTGPAPCITGTGQTTNPRWLQL